jgi:hypothetical protein
MDLTGGISAWLHHGRRSAAAYTCRPASWAMIDVSNDQSSRLTSLYSFGLIILHLLSTLLHS